MNEVQLALRSHRDVLAKIIAIHRNNIAVLTADLAEETEALNKLLNRKGEIDAALAVDAEREA